MKQSDKSTNKNFRKVVKDFKYYKINQMKNKLEAH